MSVQMISNIADMMMICIVTSLLQLVSISGHANRDAGTCRQWRFCLHWEDAANASVHYLEDSTQSEVFGLDFLDFRLGLKPVALSYATFALFNNHIHCPP